MNELQITNRAGERLDYQFHPGDRLGVLVVIGHGLTANMDRPHLVALAKGLSAKGWPCLRFSFSGNGNSEGDFEQSCITKEIGDLQAVLGAVPDSVSVLYLGHSMGGAVGVLTAVRDLRIRALVSLSGMTRTAEFVARELGDVTPGEGFMWDKRECPLSQHFVDDLQLIETTLDAAAAVSQPWLIIHGTADDVVPIQDGKDAFEAATCDKEWLEIEGAEHLFDEASYPKLVEAVDGFLGRHFN